ncbi:MULTISPECIES: hypothetical protein [Methylobacterium]|uniref:hypothetical protein n=2 Tax=Methylobacteriaceae TaxID=119045 RepID=UPI0011C1E18A|nr:MULTISPECIES: hypothetical protein [Methylobacterium]QEE38994.1 hypothetical protein FVA80_08565 [Methylobacterium sp. WL1]TXM97640.1 hypothetical protein FV242_31070 [Methylobacterium sp. WL64]TXN53936.1 hypothetical protein FV241_26180 [Methylobacterium sp. WL2]TXN62506.1 hypothetical protein FV228_19260 [Methylobacterium sp. WL18]GJE25036.1 hypothetical protein JHFBIEKO_5515 [Methylobacterium mesophilicum]
MVKPGTPTCEVSVEGAWVAMTVDEAQARHRDALKRCPACFGRLMIQGGYTAVRRASPSHFRVHDGCPLIPRHYKGAPSRHPAAIS